MGTKMHVSHLVAALLLLVGTAALGWGRQDYIDVEIGGAAARLLIGVSSMLLGGLLLLLSQLRQSVEH